jgi:protein-disulfide isomerase
MRPVLFLLALAIVGCHQADAHPAPVASAPVELAAHDQQGKAAPQARAVPDPRVTRADLSRIDGKPNAKLWILIVSDFQCPYCKEYHDKTGKQVHKEFVETGIARVAYINYPLKIHRNAVPASEAAMCAGAQDKFWPFHDKLFENQQALTRDKLEAHAQAVGLDLTKFKAALDGNTHAAAVDRDMKLGEGVKVNGTPTMFLNGKRVENPTDVGFVSALIDAELKAAPPG